MEILLTLLGLGGIFWGWMGLWSSKLHEFLSSLRAGPKGCVLRVLGLLLADGAPTVGWKAEDFLTGQPDFFTETAVTPERKVEKSIPRWEMNGLSEGY